MMVMVKLLCCCYRQCLHVPRRCSSLQAVAVAVAVAVAAAAAAEAAAAEAAAAAQRQ